MNNYAKTCTVLLIFLFATVQPASCEPSSAVKMALRLSACFLGQTNATSGLAQAGIDCFGTSSAQELDALTSSYEEVQLSDAIHELLRIDIIISFCFMIGIAGYSMALCAAGGKACEIQGSENR